MVVHSDRTGYLRDVIFNNAADTGGIISLVEGTRPRIKSRVVRLHGLVQHHVMPVLGDLAGQFPRMGNPGQDGKGDGNIETEKLPSPGDAVPDIVDDKGELRPGNHPQAKERFLPRAGKRR